MRTSTLETIAGRINEETLGVVRGSAMWSKRITKYTTGGLRGLQYSSMDDISEGLNDAKNAAEAKAKAIAKAMGADAIVALRLEIHEMSDGMFTAVATGTAVKTSALPAALPAFGNVANDDDDEIGMMPFMSKPVLRAVSHMMH